jgi:hypothetical protein
VQATVDFDPAAGDVSGRLGTQISDERGDFGRPSHAGRWDAGLGQHELAALLIGTGAEVVLQIVERVLRLDPTRCDGVDRDAVSGVLVGDRLEQADGRRSTGIGDRVMNVARRFLRGGRADVDESPQPASFIAGSTA